MNVTRRDLFHFGLSGLAATAAMHLLSGDAKAKPHHAAKAKRVVQISLVGGLSHLDSLDHKPALTKLHGKSLNSTEKPDVFFGQVGLLRQPDWAFAKRGKSGLWMSDLFPEVATCADDLTVVNSMVADSANHTPALFVQNSGFQFNGYPALGSWLSYGLGSETEELPAFVVLPDGRGEANGAASNWTAGFLPAEHQGVVFRGSPSPVRDLFPDKPVSDAEEKDTRAALAALNKQHAATSPLDNSLVARMRSYELAAKMQLAVPKVANLDGEPESIKKLYGIDRKETEDTGRRCLLARRLLEQGVRFVQVYSGGPIAGSPRTSWDAHENVKENHGAEAGRIDRPIAGLLKDLKQRGMLADTLVLFTTEFGRTPFAQSAAGTVGPGRDHNKYAFSCWLAGAGLKPGTAYGTTDEIGWKVADKPVAWHDFHATVLHLLGLDHEKLAFYHNGIKRRLTNVHGDVVKGVLA